MHQPSSAQTGPSSSSGHSANFVPESLLTSAPSALPPPSSSLPQDPPPPGSPLEEGKKKTNPKFGLACLKCRTRKIKCDGTRPICENCVRKGFECHFDETPKRRGPDRQPGRKRRTAAQKAAEELEAAEARARGEPPPPLPLKKARRRSSAGEAAAVSSIAVASASSAASAAACGALPPGSFVDGELYGLPASGGESGGGTVATAPPEQRKRKLSSSNTTIKLEPLGGGLMRPSSSPADAFAVFHQSPTSSSSDFGEDKILRVGPGGSSMYNAEPSSGGFLHHRSAPMSQPQQQQQQQPIYPVVQPQRQHSFYPPPDPLPHISAVTSSSASSSLRHHSTGYPQQQQQVDSNPFAPNPSHFYQAAQQPQQHQHQQHQQQHQQQSSLQPQAFHQPHHPSNFYPTAPPPQLAAHLLYASHTVPCGNGNSTGNNSNAPQQHHLPSDHELSPFLYEKPFFPSHPEPPIFFPSAAAIQQQQQQQQQRQQQQQQPHYASSISSPSSNRSRTPATGAAAPAGSGPPASSGSSSHAYNPFGSVVPTAPPISKQQQRQQQQQQQQPNPSGPTSSSHHAHSHQPSSHARVVLTPAWPPVPGSGLLIHPQDNVDAVAFSPGVVEDSWVISGAGQRSKVNVHELFSPGDPMVVPTLAHSTDIAIGDFSLNTRRLERAKTASSDGDGSSSHSPGPVIVRGPSSEYTRKIWWDTLLSQFGPTREAAYSRVVSEVGHLFRISNHWLAFFNVPLFVATLHHPAERHTIQPALVYSMLALSTQMSSYEGPGGRGFEGKLLGLQLWEQAQASFWSSWNSGWIDSGLAKAAFLMALYEVNAHPLHSHARIISSMLLLDNVLRTLAFPALDAADPNATVHPHNEIPAVPSTGLIAPMQSYAQLGLHAEQDTSKFSFWAFCPRWSKPGAATPPSLAEIQKEESRRLSWSASALAASFSMCLHNLNIRPLDLHIGDPENYALLFPGESLFDGPTSGKTSIWALYHTSNMLWNFAIKLHYSDRPDEEKSKKAIEIWAVTQKIEALFEIAKGTSRLGEEQPWHERIGLLAYSWQAHDMLLTARFLITDAFQKFIPIASSGAQSTSTFHVASARQWLYTQAKVAQTLSPVSSEFGEPFRKSSVSLIDHRPVWIYWLMQQLSRAIQLYEVEPSFTEALDIAREDFCSLLGYLCRLYPSEGIYATLSVMIFRLNVANERASQAYATARALEDPSLANDKPRYPPVDVDLPTPRSSESILRLMASRPLPSGRDMSELSTTS